MSLVASDRKGQQGLKDDILPLGYSIILIKSSIRVHLNDFLDSLTWCFPVVFRNIIDTSTKKPTTVHIVKYILLELL